MGVGSKQDVFSFLVNEYLDRIHKNEFLRASSSVHRAHLLQIIRGMALRIKGDDFTSWINCPMHYIYFVT